MTGDNGGFEVGGTAGNKLVDATVDGPGAVIKKFAESLGVAN